MSLIERAAGIVEKLAEPAGTPAVAKKTEVPLIERAINNKDHSHFGPTPNRSSDAAIGSSAPTGGATPRVRHIDLNRLRKQSIMTPDQERSAISENFRRIKRHILSNVGKTNSERSTNLIMITSALPGEGKTFCAINLAISLAMEVDRTVLLVDADVARPSVTAALGIHSDDELGLMDVLLGDSIDVASVLCKTDIGKLSVIPAGSHHSRSTEILASERMGRLLEELSERYHDRIIIFDSPPLLAASEASVLASQMGQILVVVESGRTTENTLKEALARIDSSNVLGVVLNKGGAPGAGYYGGYDYGYGYGYSR